jgi:hypothetical protein
MGEGARPGNMHKAIGHIRTALLLSCLLGASLAFGADADLEKRLSSKDAAVANAAADELIRSADRAEPLSLMLASSRLFQRGDRDNAVYWFYAGQLRARYSPQLTGENAQLIAIFLMTIGEPINAYAMRDIKKMTPVLDRVLKWDEQTFPAWARENKIDPANPELLQRRVRARDGLAALIAELKSKPEEYERKAREYKSPEELQREQILAQEELVKRGYSTVPLDWNVGGRILRIPANYTTPGGYSTPPNPTLTELVAVVFLPDFVGYTRDNWRGLGDNRNVMFVRIGADGRRKPEEVIEAFIATQPPVTKAFGFDAYYFDSRKTKAQLPLSGYSVEYVFAGKRAKGDAAYVVCQAPEPNITRPNPQCEVFIFDRPSGLRMHTRFSQDHAAKWPQIVARLSELLDSWVIAQ